MFSMSGYKTGIDTCLPSDEELFSREEVWLYLIKDCDVAITNNYDDLEVEWETVEDIPRVANFLQNSNSNEVPIISASLSEKLNEDESASDIISENITDDGFDVPAACEVLTKVIEKRKDNWIKFGVKFVMQNMEFDKKVENWLEKNMNFMNEDSMRNCIPHLGDSPIRHQSVSGIKMTQKRELRISQSSDCDSLGSVDTAQYILSNKNKKISTKMTMTIKNYCVMEQMNRTKFDNRKELPVITYPINSNLSTKGEKSKSNRKKEDCRVVPNCKKMKDKISKAKLKKKQMPSFSSSDEFDDDNQNNNINRNKLKKINPQIRRKHKPFPEVKQEIIDSIDLDDDESTDNLPLTFLASKKQDDSVLEANKNRIEPENKFSKSSKNIPLRNIGVLSNQITISSSDSSEGLLIEKDKLKNNYLPESVSSKNSSALSNINMKSSRSNNNTKLPNGKKIDLYINNNSDNIFWLDISGKPQTFEWEKNAVVIYHPNQSHLQKNKNGKVKLTRNDLAKVLNENIFQKMLPNPFQSKEINSDSILLYVPPLDDDESDEESSDNETDILERNMTIGYFLEIKK